MHKSQPWWKYGHVWLVVGGPAVVVVASIITLYLAVRDPDVVQTDSRSPVDTLRATPSIAHAPAGLARNHAQTGVPEKVLQSNR